MKTKFNQSKLKLTFISAVVVGSAGFGTASFAGSDAQTLAIGASVSDSCTIATSAIDFGDYVGDGTSGKVHGTGGVTATCTLGGAAVITMSQGSNAVTTPIASTDASPKRQMAGSSSGYLLYDLYSGGEETTVWGNTTDTGLAFTATAGVNPQQTVYGTVNPSQTVVAGTYSDTVTVTITY
jgi:spore coat protein U-like protein